MAYADEQDGLSFPKDRQVATLKSVSAPSSAIAQAERQVRRDRSQVQEDSDRLSQSQAQLVRDQRQLDAHQQQARTQAQVNSEGQAIGRLINTTA